MARIERYVVLPDIEPHKVILFLEYRRDRTPGASYFFTLVTHQRRPLLAVEEAVDRLRDAFRRVRARRAFTVEAMVILPDHLHCIWTLPPGDADFSTRWRLIKSRFTRSNPVDGRVKPGSARRRKHEAAIWQHRFWEHRLRDDRDFRNHVEYIHYNPIKHGLVERLADWPWSSFHRYVERGLYPPDWGSSVPDLPDCPEYVGFAGARTWG